MTSFERLKNNLRGELLADLPGRLLYHTSASSNAVVPRAVVRPRDAEDVRTTVEFCREEGIPITARGAGTGMAGNNLGGGVVVDFVRFMSAILDVDPGTRKVRVQPGVIYGDLNRHLAPHQLFLPPDPSSGDFCTLGGMVGNNAAGPHTLKYGATRDYLSEVKGILASGDSLDRAPSSQLVELETFLRSKEQTILQGYPRVSKNASGYLLRDAMQGNQLDWARMLCGSEGTLALFTELEFTLAVTPPVRGLLLATFTSLENAGQAVLQARESHPSALEILDGNSVREILAQDLPAAAHLHASDEAILLIEAEGGGVGEVERILTDLQEAVGAMARDSLVTLDPAEQESLWALRKIAAVRARREDTKKPIRVVEDATVPVERVPDYIAGARRILEQNGIEGIMLGHAGNGNIHVETLIDVRDPDLKSRLARLQGEVAQLVTELGGTLSGEHGDGVVRSKWVPQVFPEMYPVFREIKRLLDAKGLLNPGALLGEGRDFLEELRYGHPLGQPGDLAFEVERCFSCGYCRTYCPEYKEGREETLPRGLASVWRGSLLGLISPGEERSATCADCDLCRDSCPAGFDPGRIRNQSLE